MQVPQRLETLGASWVFGLPSDAVVCGGRMIPLAVPKVSSSCPRGRSRSLLSDVNSTRAQHPSLDTRTLGSITKIEHTVSRLDENDVMWLPAPFSFMAVGETESYMAVAAPWTDSRSHSYTKPARGVLVQACMFAQDWESSPAWASCGFRLSPVCFLSILTHLNKDVIFAATTIIRSLAR